MALWWRVRQDRHRLVESPPLRFTAPYLAGLVLLAVVMVASLGETGLADAYADVVAMAGELERQGEPQLLDLAGVTVAEVPLFHEAADLTGRLSFAANGTVVGLWFVPATPSPGSTLAEGRQS